MKTRDLACLTASFVAASILTTGGAASAFRRIPALSCVPTSNTFVVGTNAAWTNTSSYYEALYCPIEEHVDPTVVSGSFDNQSHTDLGTAQADKFAAWAVYVDFVVHQSGHVSEAAACVEYNTDSGIDCGATAFVPSNAGAGWHNVSLDQSAWHNTANSGDYTYVWVVLPPSYASQLQGVYIVDVAG